MKTCNRKEKFGNFRIILDSRRSSTIVMGKLMSKLKQKESTKTMWEAQAGKFMTSKKVDIDFCLPEFSATKIVKRKFHVYESTTGRYIMILVRYLLTALGLDHKLSDNIIIGVNGPYEEVSSDMVDVSKHDFTY